MCRLVIIKRTHCCVAMVTLLIFPSFPFKSYSNKILRLINWCKRGKLPEIQKTVSVRVYVFHIWLLCFSFQFWVKIKYPEARNWNLRLLRPCCHLRNVVKYRLFREQLIIIPENIPYIKLRRYNHTFVYPKLNGYGDRSDTRFKKWRLLYSLITKCSLQLREIFISCNMNTSTQYLIHFWMTQR
jgi:hypothetical protein